MMSVHEFRDEDAAYLKWTSQHRGGYTINIQRTLNPSNARLHRADCRTVSGSHPRNGPRTSHYIKVCANDIAELDAWATAHGLGAIGRCAVCHPTQQTAATRDSTPRGAAPPIPVPSIRATAVRDPSPNHRASKCGPMSMSTLSVGLPGKTGCELTFARGFAYFGPARRRSCMRHSSDPNHGEPTLRTSRCTTSTRPGPPSATLLGSVSGLNSGPTKHSAKGRSTATDMS